MVRISKTGSTLKQTAYARRIWGAKGADKKQIALDVGYTKNVAESPKSKIEVTRGFNNAMALLAAESNNVALQVLSEFKARGVTDFSNKDLIGALNAIGSAWKAFNQPMRDVENEQGKNKLRTVILQNIENQTLSTTEPVAEQVIREVTPSEVDTSLDF